MSGMEFTESSEGAKIVDPSELTAGDIDPAESGRAAQEMVNSLKEDSEHKEHPVIEFPPDGSVSLMVGLPIKGEIVFTAVVRELTGADEEYLAQPANTKTGLRFMKAVLERALVKVGDHKPTSYTIQDLSLADAEVLVRAVRCVTFGNQLRLNGFKCPTCQHEMDIMYDLMEDVPVQKPVGEKGQQTYEFTATTGQKIKYRLPTIGDQTKVVDADVSTLAEANTIMLAEIVDSVDGAPIVYARDMRNMSMRLRREILNEIDKMNPGLRYQDVEHECASCGVKFPLVLTTGDLFRY